MFRMESRISFCAAAAARAAAPLARFNDGFDGSSSIAQPGIAGKAVKSPSSKTNDPSYGGGDVIDEDGVEGRCFRLVLMQRRSQPDVLD